METCDSQIFLFFQWFVYFEWCTIYWWYNKEQHPRGALAAAVFLAALAAGAAAVPKGGSVAYLGQFPWHAAILSAADGGDLLGSGALLSQQYVLTAASALQVGGQQLAAVSVLLGAVAASNSPNPDGRGTTVSSKGLTRHERWDTASADCDLALVQLEESVLVSDRIRPIRLPARYAKEATYVGQTLSVSSWGASDGDDQGGWLSVYNVEVIRNMDCQAKQADPTTPLPWTKMCAAAADGSPVPGKGDNGDPMVFLEEDGYTLIGVVSSDVQAAGPRPTTLARLTEQLDWIRDNSDVTIDE